MMNNIKNVKNYLFYSLVTLSVICIILVFASVISLNVYGETPAIVDLFKAGIIGFATSVSLLAMGGVYLCCSAALSHITNDSALPHDSVVPLEVVARPNRDESVIIPSRGYESVPELSLSFSFNFGPLTLARSRSPVYPQSVQENPEQEEIIVRAKEDALCVPVPSLIIYPLSRSRSPANSATKETDCLVMKDTAIEPGKQKIC